MANATRSPIQIDAEPFILNAEGRSVATGSAADTPKHQQNQRTTPPVQ